MPSTQPLPEPPEPQAQAAVERPAAAGEATRRRTASSDQRPGRRAREHHEHDSRMRCTPGSRGEVATASGPGRDADVRPTGRPRAGGSRPGAAAGASSSSEPRACSRAARPRRRRCPRPSSASSARMDPVVGHRQEAAVDGGDHRVAGLLADPGPCRRPSMPSSGAWSRQDADLAVGGPGDDHGRLAGPDRPVGGDQLDRAAGRSRQPFFSSSLALRLDVLEATAHEERLLGDVVVLALGELLERVDGLVERHERAVDGR